LKEKKGGVREGEGGVYVYKFIYIEKTNKQKNENKNADGKEIKNLIYIFFLYHRIKNFSNQLKIFRQIRIYIMDKEI
jgi:hypothetical protein